MLYAPRKLRGLGLANTRKEMHVQPKIIYPMQAAPINKIPKQHLDILDITISEIANS